MTQMEGSITNDATHAGVKRDHADVSDSSWASPELQKNRSFAWDASDDAYVEHRRAMKAEELRVKSLNYLSGYTLGAAALFRGPQAF